MKLRVVILAMLLVMVPLGMGNAQQPMTMYDTLKAMGNFKTFLAAVDKANVGQLKQMAGPFTLFAPTDEAFAKLPKKALDNIMNDPAILRSVVYYHLTPGKYLVKDLPNLKQCKTLCPTAEPELLNFTEMNGKFMVTGADGGSGNIVKPDVLATNGVIQVIDVVLLPKFAPPKNL
jgi:transforming growth factor-beta-induced protein